MKHLNAMHQIIMIKMKNFTSEDWVVIKTIVKHSVKIFEY